MNIFQYLKAKLLSTNTHKTDSVLRYKTKISLFNTPREFFSISGTTLVNMVRVV